MPNTFWSPTLSAGISILGPLWTAFQRWERSASSRESCMLISDFISIASSISEENFDQERQMYSMLTVATQTLNHLVELHGQVLIMQSRMVTLSVEDSHARVSLGLNPLETMCVNTLKSRMRTISNIFGSYFTTWIQRQLSSTLAQPPSTQRHGLPMWNPDTSLEEDRSLWVEMMTVEMHGMTNLASDLLNHFEVTPHPPARHPSLRGEPKATIPFISLLGRSPLGRCKANCLGQ